LWLKLQTVKGCYGCRYNDVQGVQKQAFEMALEFIAEKRVRVNDMLTHKFRIEDYRKMIEVNIRKKPNKAIKTAISFE
jgi:threonine dehydrogenase-like Zn-dependent dehydrogenase